ncbi:hypothetical protein [Pseudoalteromonas sp. ASV78]|uniref:hypothetical protein n=1 Tax=Pseudoalteromonas sp. ASV78 TaxID=3397851 RepID=UPI0039FD928B
MDLVDRKGFLSRLKKEQGYTAQDIAEHLKVSVSEVTDWLDFTEQNCAPTTAQVKKLMKMGECKPLSSLVFGSSDDDALLSLEKIHNDMKKDASASCSWADRILSVINMLKTG